MATIERPVCNGKLDDELGAVMNHVAEGVNGTATN